MKKLLLPAIIFLVFFSILNFSCYGETLNTKSVTLTNWSFGPIHLIVPQVEEFNESNQLLKGESRTITVDVVFQKEHENALVLVQAGIGGEVVGEEFLDVSWDNPDVFATWDGSSFVQ